MMEKNGNNALLPELRDLFLGEIDRETKRLAICLLAAFVTGLAAHSWGFLHMTVNQDSLSEFYLSLGWKFYLGRYAEPVLRYAMGEMMVLPWLTGLTGLSFLAVAVYLMSRMFSLNRVWENVVLSGVCAANAVMTTLIATYVHDFAGDMLALLLAVSAAYAWTQMGAEFSWKYTLVGGACLFGCIAIYQAYLAVTLTLLCIYAIMGLLRGKTAGQSIRNLLRAIPMGLLALAAYGVCVLTATRVLGCELGGNGGNDMTKVGENLLELSALVAQGYVQTMRDLFLPHWTSVKAVFGPTDLLIGLLNAALCAKAALIMVRQIKKNRLKLPEILLALALILALPLCMTSICIVSKVFHYLLRYAGLLFYLLILVVLGLERENMAPRKACWQQLLAAVVIGVMILSNIQVANTAYEKKDLEERATLATMTRVLDRLEEYENYRFGESEVLFAGVISSHQAPLRVGKADCMLGMGPSSQIAYNGLESNYLKVFMRYPVNSCDSAEKRQQILESEEFRAMGSFPDRDCIATIDGVIVVKLSDSDTDY